MNIDGISTKFIEDRGLHLDEDEDFVYLTHKEKILARWYAPAADVNEIRRTALRWAVVYKKRENKLQSLLPLD